MQKNCLVLFSIDIVYIKDRITANCVLKSVCRRCWVCVRPSDETNKFLMSWSGSISIMKRPVGKNKSLYNMIWNNCKLTSHHFQLVVKYLVMWRAALAALQWAITMIMKTFRMMIVRRRMMVIGSDQALAGSRISITGFFGTGFPNIFDPGI